MRDYSVQNKKAWEYSAYAFWVKNSGTPAERAQKDMENPLGALKRYANYFDGLCQCADCEYMRLLREKSNSACAFGGGCDGF